MANRTFVTFCASALLLGALAPAGARGLSHEVHFRKGTHSAQYSGTVRGYDYDRYVLSARAGQRLNVYITGRNAQAIVGGPGLSDLIDVTSQSLTLPRTGRYEVRVLQPRTFARRGNVQPYKMTIDIR